MGFERGNLNDGRIVGKEIYSPIPPHHSLGVVQLITKADGGHWVILRTATGHIDIQWINAKRGAMIHNDDDEPEGYRIQVPGSRGRGKVPGAEDADASWSAREGLGDEDDEDDPDPLKYPTEEAAAASDDSIRNREPQIIRLPDDPNSDIAAYPAGRDYGRNAMASLENSKITLAQAAETATTQAVAIAGTGQDIAHYLVGAEQLNQAIELWLGLVRKAEQDLIEEAALVTIATEGHSRPDPAQGVEMLRQAEGRLEQMRTNLVTARRSIETVLSMLRPIPNLADGAQHLARNAAETFKRYRASY